ncbi:helix-turn-helix domain-containing protein [Paraflavitalea sp. CAU 1676]|uniref:winged helix-turn-helix transcriptional regulator n=1 Tax=Paraflavitalea sp. CAU 1676 TaxID=3032598 RepID=UPI0023DC1321|nr:helix-turn-helix domain-containing protein [Paraflavitalea sp. CAU 1676]MDF2192433.1 helix-turn-helix domain-containing protein [Paraflavitalea sp. CAU 1676]
MSTFEKELKNVKSCSAEYVLAVNDTLNVLNGKWKLPIIGTLLFGKKRFREIERCIPNITSRMLSKELKELELNGMVKRTVYDSIPVCVEYELTKSGKTLTLVLDSMAVWGLRHRKVVMTNE